MLPPPDKKRRSSFFALGLLAVLGILVAPRPGPTLGPNAVRAAEEARPAKPTKRDAELARTQCTSCHLLPPPDVLPRASWRSEIHKMAALQAGGDLPSWGEAARPVPLSADMEGVLRYYEANAPVALPTPEPWPAPDGAGPRFARHAFSYPDATSQEPATANVRFLDLDRDARLEIVACDMRHGVVLLGRPYEPETPLLTLARIPNPDHSTLVDLDRDGIKDLLVADLGGFLPADHDRGQVVWLRGLPGGGFATYAMGGFPRVADVEPADFFGEGRLDLIVAAFGWRRTGGLALLRNQTSSYARPSFERLAIDPRPGPIHAVPVDLDKDGRMDFVTVIAQEHETVEAFLNEGQGKFRKEVLYRAPHPNWGSSGLELVDLDGDGDLDVLVTNGDMFDDNLLKPYHGIRWLENRGTYPFVEHFLAPLAGVHRAVAVDLDGDADLDVVASAFTPGATAAGKRLPSLVWLEQTRRGQFKRHSLEMDRLTHATLDAADYDGDGDVDLVVGNFVEGQESQTWFEVWENLSARPHPGPRETGGNR